MVRVTVTLRARGTPRLHCSCKTCILCEYVPGTSDGRREPFFSGLSTGHDPARGSGSERFQNCAGRVGSGQEVFKSHGTGQVTSTRSDPSTLIRPIKSPDSFFCLETCHTRTSIWTRRQKQSTHTYYLGKQKQKNVFAPKNNDIPTILGQGGLTPLQLETRFWGQNYLDLV